MKKNMKVKQSSQEKDASTVDKSINQDDVWYMVKGVTNAARPTTLMCFSEGPIPVQ